VAPLLGRRNVHFLHIGKTGGTALRTTLQHHGWGRYNLVFHPHRSLLTDIPRGELVVFFLRDPVTRFVSGFDNQRRHAAPYYNVEWSDGERVAFERFGNAEALALALGSGDAGSRAAAETAMEEIHHLRQPFWDWFGDEAYFRSRLEDVFFVGFQETFTADFAALRQKLQLTDDVQLPDDERLTQRRPDAAVPLSAEAGELVRAWYAADYRLIRVVEQTLLDRPAPIEFDRELVDNA
jgi:hypothetical protein